MKYLLDTNTCIRFINGRTPKIRQQMLSIADTESAISTITMGEMFAVLPSANIHSNRVPNKMPFSFALFI